jgi:hypothetical protein
MRSIRFVLRKVFFHTIYLLKFNPANIPTAPAAHVLTAGLFFDFLIFYFLKPMPGLFLFALQALCLVGINCFLFF